MQDSLNLSRIGNGGTRKATLLLIGIAMNHFKQFLLQFSASHLEAKFFQGRKPCFCESRDNFLREDSLTAVWSVSMRSKKVKWRISVIWGRKGLFRSSERNNKKNVRNESNLERPQS